MSRIATTNATMTRRIAHPLEFDRLSQLNNSGPTSFASTNMPTVQHATAVPETVLQTRAALDDYHVCVTHAHKPNRFYTYPFVMEAELPGFPIPLMPSDDGVPVDLQTVMNRVYCEGDYEAHGIYDQELVPPAAAERVTWIKRLLRRRGITA